MQLRKLLVLLLLLLAGCAGSPPRLCFHQNEEAGWHAFSPPRSTAQELEKIATASPPTSLGAAQNKIQEQRSYWFRNQRGDVALCYQTPGSQDFCFSSVWTFVQSGSKWQVASSSWNMCTE